MGWLTPLYLAGLAALSLPLLLHLIRRTPRGRQAFSSLMFLSPSPPRLTRRSRVDHWLLLLLRLVALALLALAFARPFLRKSALLPLSDAPSRRVALLIDTSASMRRGDLWKQARTIIEDTLADLGPNDDVALFTFDERLKTLVDFSPGPQTSPANKAELVRSQLDQLSPTWGSTDLGSALVAVAGELQRADDAATPTAEPHLVLVSDLQRGSKTDALQAYPWPREVRVQVHALSPDQPGNASLQVLADENRSGAEAPRVRVSNSADSLADQFTLRWAVGAAQSPTDEAIAIYVPPGQSRVVRLPRPDAPAADRVVLAGDIAEFDNTFYVAPPRQQQVRLVYLGRDAPDDPQGLQYYLRLALADDRVRSVEISSPSDDGPLTASGTDSPQLVMVARPVTAARCEQLGQYLESGGTLLAVLVDRETAESLRKLWDDVQLTDAPSEAAEPANGQDPSGNDHYQLLGEIDFSHPLFSQFADPRYGDFTKIHFWRWQAVRLGEPATARAVAWFDNGAPAMLERATGEGHAFIFTTGWRPDDSQLALSSKFVPLMQAVVDLACGPPLESAGVVVHQAAPLPAPRAAQPTVVEKPDGSRVNLTSDSQTFDQTDSPGIYRMLDSSDDYRFAVNLSPAESVTEPMDIEQLEQLGVRLGDRFTRSQRAEQVRQQRDTELESRQKVWRWLIAAALAVLIMETWLAGRRAPLE
ncbi:MAG TPA: BatA domain-containing protein [Pirellulales bacterium]